MRRVLFIIFIFFLGDTLAQQNFTQYYVNDMLINPAVSGSKSYSPLIIQTRKQWLGFEGAPFTSSITYHGALNNRSAMGGYLMFDQLGPTSIANVHLNYAYHIPLDYDQMNLSFGLGAKLMYYNIDFNIDDLPPGQDDAFSANTYDKILSDASSGIYLYARKFYVGFSISNMLESSFNSTVDGSPYPNAELRNYYGMAAYRFNIINNDWQFEPSFLIRKAKFQRSIVDLSTRIIYLENIWSGLTYRTNETAVFTFGLRANDIYISYSYDHTFAGEIMQANYGTHELGISFRIETMATKRHIGFWGY